jgi:hypothetical protein
MSVRMTPFTGGGVGIVFYGVISMCCAICPRRHFDTPYLNREQLEGSAKGKRRVPFPGGVPCAVLPPSTGRPGGQQWLPI